MGSGPWILALSVFFSLFVPSCTCRSDQDFLGEDIGTDPVIVPAPESIGAWLSMDRSPEGSRITMSFYDREEGALAWALGGVEDDGSVTWAYERVEGYDDPLDVGKYSSQKTAPDGTVWVAYQDVQAQSLRVAHRTAPGVWAVVTADAGPGVGNWISLALDAAGRPVIAHTAGDEGVRLTRYDGAAFTTASVYTGPAAYAAMSVVGDREYIAFQDTGAGALHLLRGVAGAFEDSVVDTGGVGAWPSLWVSGTEVRVAYQDVTAQHLKYASQAGTAPWTIELVDGADLRGADTALFERDGEPAIVYFDGYGNDQWVARRSGGAWALEKVTGDQGAVGYHNEVVEVAGRVYTGSYDFTTDGLVLSIL
jgi:hypothetical protein